MSPASLATAGHFMSGLGGETAFPAEHVAANIQSSTASMRHIISQAAGGYTPPEMYHQLMAADRQVSCLSVLCIVCSVCGQRHLTVDVE